MKDFFKVAIHPTPEPETIDTSLRFTDILFGFVIRELFLRLRNIPELDPDTIAHLFVATALVIGSWVGFRRSLNRSSYTVKFFNLPLFKFLLDQAMLVLYFRVAVLTPENPPAHVDPTLGVSTLEFITYVFVVYLFWDLAGMWMAAAKDETGNPRYPRVDKDKKRSSEAEYVDWPGAVITGTALLLFAVLWRFATQLPTMVSAVAAFGVLIAYRFVKEIKTSRRAARVTASA